MIAYSAIQNLAQKLQTTELNVRREYIQHVFLSYFYQQPDSNTIYFKGGTALRILNKSPRFSEDLDFSSTARPFRKIEDIIVRTIRQIEREGIGVDIRESKKTSGGYLAIMHFNVRNQKVAIQIEISQRKKTRAGEVITVVGDFIPPYTLIALSRDELVSEKVQALLTRKKARDFYDLYYILRAQLLPVKEKYILKKVLMLLDKTDLHFERELKLFLPKSHWAVIRNFRRTLKQEIQRSAV